jgi:hypothetical protein
VDFLRRLAAVLGGVAVLVAVVTVAGGGVPKAGAETTPDYRRALQVIADLRAFPPEVPLVVLLGGSSQRSSTVSDLSLTRQIRARVGYKMVAFNLGSKERLLTTDRRLAGLLPDVHPIVYIGVNMGRFCRGRGDPSVTLPNASKQAPTPQPRSPKPLDPLSDARKRQMVTEWMQKRWPAFLNNYRYELGVLESTVRLSLKKGQHPVIIDLPRNMAIMGHQLDRPLGIYHAGCRAIARRNGIPYVQFQGAVNIGNRDFRDLWHLLPTSRIKWQTQLSATTAKLLKRYGLHPSPSPSPSPTPTPSESVTPTPGL